MAVLKTVSNLRDSVSGILSGLNLNNVSNINGAFERAARTMLQKADVPEASGIQNIVLYSGVTDYAVDTTIFGTDLVDIRPQGISRQPWDMVTKTSQSQFDRTKGYLPSGVMAAFQYTNGVPTLRIVSNQPTTNVTIDPCTAIGNWVASGTASGLAIDSTNYYQSPASLRFNSTTGAAILTDSITSTTSFSTYQSVGVAFLAIEIPSGATATNLTSIQLKFGSSSSNYNSVTQTTGFSQSFTAGQWMLIPFDFSTASTVGTPNWNAITYVQLTFNTTGSFTNFRIGDLFMSLPSPNQILYQSAAVFLPSGSSTPLTTITANTDTIIFNNPAYSIYEFECALAVLLQTGAGASDDTANNIHGILNGARARNGTVINLGLYDLFRGDSPSQQLRQTGSYYDTVGSNGWDGYGYRGIGGS